MSSLGAKGNMSLRVKGVFSTNPSSQGAIEEALEALSLEVRSPVLLFLFTTDGYDQEVIWRAVKGKYPQTKFVGMCGCGVIYEREVWEQAIVLCAIEGEGVEVSTALEGPINEDPRATGSRCAKKLLSTGFKEGVVFVFPDGFSSNVAEVVREIYISMGPPFSYVGGCAGDNLKLFRTYQFTEEGVRSDGIATALLKGVKVGSAIAHGWSPKGTFYVITRAEGKRVFEIDGETAFEAYARSLGGVVEKGRFAEYGLRYPLGIIGPSGYFLIRDPWMVNPDGSIDFVTEVPPRAVAFTMECKTEALIETARTVAKEAVKKVRVPKVLLVFDCVSRYKLLGDRFLEELQAVKETVGEGIPLLGALTFGEIGCIDGVPLLHNKTILVVAIGEEGTKG